MRPVRSFGAAVLGLSLALLGAGCQRGGEEGAAAAPGGEAAGPPLVGVTLLNRQHVFYQDLEAGMREAAARLGLELDVASADFDAAKQANQVDDFIVKGVSAIVICPCDSIAVGGAVTAANRAGIPVFTADIASRASEGKVVCHVASDNFQGGMVAGRLLVRGLVEAGYVDEAGAPAGEVAIIDHPLVTSVQERTAGFRAALEEYPGVKIVAAVPAGGQRAEAMAATDDVLQKYPKVAGIFGINDDSALGALAAVESVGRRNVVIVGYDATPEARKAIAEGRIYGDTIQYPREIGRLAMEAVADYLAGKPVPPVIKVPTGAWTQAGEEKL